MAGMAAAGAVAAALFARERTGEGQLVSTSLLRTGVYMMGWDISMAPAHAGADHPDDDRGPAQPAHQRVHRGRRSPVLDAGAPGQPPLARRPAGGRPPGLGRGRTLRLDARTAPRTPPSWCGSSTPSSPRRPSTSGAPIFDREDVWWAPVQHAARDDRRPAGASPRAASSTSPRRTAASQCAWSHRRRTSRARPLAPRSMPPEHGQHTEEVLLELGYDWDKIIELKDAGAIP